MIVPDFKGLAEGLLGALTHIETETSAPEDTSTVFARKTGIFGRRSRHAAILEETGPKRSAPTAMAMSKSTNSLAQTIATSTTSHVEVSRTAATPGPILVFADIEGRQVQATRSANEDVTTIRSTALVVVESSTTRTFITAASTTLPTTRSMTTLPASTTASTTASSTSSTDPATTTSSTSTSSSTSTPSASKPPVGAIAGGAIGGFLALLLALFLIAFLVRRHRKNIEKRRLEEANPFFPKTNKTSTPPPPIYQDRPNGGHHRSGSTSHDIYGTMGGTSSSSRTKVSEKKGRLIDPYSLQANPAPGLRAEGGPGLPPAAFLRPAQMLDGRPINEIGGVERPRSVRSVKGSRFGEHFQAVEMEDTSSFHAASPAQSIQRAPPSSSLSQDSPILGRNSAFSSSAATTSSLASDVVRRQHLMSWSTYASDGDGEEMSATLNSAKTPPSARHSPSQVSPPLSSGGETLSNSSYVVSPLRKDKF